MMRRCEPLGLIQPWPGEILGTDQPILRWPMAHIRPRQEKPLASVMRRHVLPWALFLRQDVRIHPGKGRQASLMTLIPNYLFRVDAPEVHDVMYDSGPIVRLLTAQRPEIVCGLRVVLQQGSWAGCTGIVMRRQSFCEVVVNVHLLGIAVAARCSARDA